MNTLNFYKEKIEEKKRKANEKALFEELEQEKQRHKQIREMFKKNEEEQEEVLTVGLLKELIGERNIPQLQRIIEGRSEYDYIDLLDREQYVAAKLWSEEDIRQVLSEEFNCDFEDEIIRDIVKNDSLNKLSECSDQEWDIIRSAVNDSRKRILNQRKREYYR